MRSNKETLKKKIGALCVVAACSQIIIYNRKHRVSNTRKRKCWIKPWLAEKHKSLHHGLVSELLLHSKEEFRIFLRMNTETYEASHFLLISRYATRWGRGGGLTCPKSCRKVCALILTLKHWIREPTQNKAPQKCIFKAYEEVKMFISWWRLQYILTGNNLLFYLSKEFYSTEQKILNVSVCLFQPFGKVKIVGSYEDQQTLDLRKSQSHSSDNPGQNLPALKKS